MYIINKYVCCRIIFNIIVLVFYNWYLDILYNDEYVMSVGFVKIKVVCVYKDYIDYVSF